MRRGGVEPLISVVMPVFNASPYLVEAVASIQAQTYRCWELIIVDDGSKDGSTEIAETLARRDQRVRMFSTPHVGHAHAFNVGVDLARGELIARMDADDVALPERFAVQLDWMRKTGAEICGSWAKRFGDQNGLLWFPAAHVAITHELLFRSSLLFPTVLMSTGIARSSRCNEHVGSEQYELWTRLANRHRMGNVPAVLVKHRCHQGQFHVREAERFATAMRSHRRPLFGSLFPEARAQDADAIDAIAEGKAFTSISELERAAEWLVHLAQSPEPMLRRRMLERWRAACRNSAKLGHQAHRIYRRHLAEFNTGQTDRDLRLRAVCALRLEGSSRPVLGFRRLRRTWMASRQAAL